MHELGIISGVLDSVRPVAQEAGATKLLGITLSVGEMTGALQDALFFAWEALCEGDPFLEEAKLTVNTIAQPLLGVRAGIRSRSVPLGVPGMRFGDDRNDCRPRVAN